MRQPLCIDRTGKETGALFGEKSHILYVNAQIKEDTEGVATMCKAMEDMRNEAAREADKDRMVKIARRMLNFGQYTYEDIADVLEVSVDEVKTLIENRPA